MTRKKGKLIVIDGNDGSGKATQTALLVKRLQDEKIKVRTIDFPQYQNNFFGELVGHCLAGDYGNFPKLDPHIASVLYAADRWESSEQIKKWLRDGYVVVIDRYVSSNQIHQGGKIEDEIKRREFLRWLSRLEFEVFKIPKPDAIIFLQVPVNISSKLILKKGASDKKAYLKGKQRDKVESNKKYVNDSYASAVKLVEQDNKWYRVECAPNGNLLAREAIHEGVFKLAEKIVKC